jgi:hypothetical protein
MGGSSTGGKLMKIRRTTALVVLLACASALVLLSVASAGSRATKQRISFLQTFNVQTGAGTWKLIPLSPGPLEADSGKQNGDGAAGASVLRNGQRVTPISGSDRMTGKQGTLVISQNLVSTNVGKRYSADIGTWKFVSGTGAYKALSGGGRFAGVGLPGGIVIINQEGWVTIG